jgi:hypothetical protein
MAISYGQLEEFAELWHDELALPFAVYGVIPNYVRQDKLELLSWAGMNHIRMGIQSGSKNMLDFYKRPTPPKRSSGRREVDAPAAVPDGPAVHAVHLLAEGHPNTASRRR